MSVKRDLARTVYAADVAIDAIYRPVAPRLASSVRKHAVQGKITQDGRQAIMRDVDAMLDALGYPTRRGQIGAMQRMIEEHANAARRFPVAEAVSTIRKHTPPDVLAAMGDDRGS
jgi:hypothetical protein